MKPKVRFLDIQALDKNSYLVRDPYGISQGLIVSYPALLLMSLMDGNRNLLDIRADFFKATGYMIKEEEIREFLELLDENLLLDGENFQKALREEKDRLIRQGIRRMSHVFEVYPADPQEAKNFLMGKEKKEKRDLLGLMVPHMDIRIAKDTYWEGYGRLKEEKELVIILGVSHYWHEMPFSALPLSMETPFGILEVRNDLIEKLQSFYNFDITHDILSYRMEHSIEFASLYVKMLYPRAKALALIVSYGDIPFLKELAENLLRVIDKDLKHALIISSVDLSHVGKKFGDMTSFDPFQRDKTYLNLLQNLASDEAFNLLQRDLNFTRIDGQYTNLVFSHMLKKAGVEKGELFDYNQYYERETDSIVSYASMGF
ncbi:MAG: AmmeMemoRadiSam system protein B [Aquificaceae bacterium]